ncbi:MAG: hypothetical protein HYX48_00660 [Chlamydiales bacterium]|nr:hypothetical protein [Chlamydiales bacterium]
MSFKSVSELAKNGVTTIFGIRAVRDFQNGEVVSGLVTSGVELAWDYCSDSDNQSLKDRVMTLLFVNAAAALSAAGAKRLFARAYKEGAAFVVGGTGICLAAAQHFVSDKTAFEKGAKLTLFISACGTVYTLGELTYLLYKHSQRERIPCESDLPTSMTRENEGYLKKKVSGVRSACESLVESCTNRLFGAKAAATQKKNA